MLGGLQRLYQEVQRALQPANVFVKGLGPSGAAHWQRQTPAGSAMHVVDLADLPGPCGSKQLHLLPETATEQPKVLPTS